MQVAAGHLHPLIHDQDVVAELFGLVEDLRGEHDRPARPRVVADQGHDRPLQNRVHPSRELVEKHDGRLHHERLCYLHATPEPSAEVHHLARHLILEAEMLKHSLGAAGEIGSCQAMKSADRSAGCRGR